MTEFFYGFGFGFITLSVGGVAGAIIYERLWHPLQQIVRLHKTINVQYAEMERYRRELQSAHEQNKNRGLDGLNMDAVEAVKLAKKTAV